MTARVPLGDALTAARSPIELDDELTYMPIGVRGFGRGIIDYGPTPATNLGKLRFFDLAPSALIVSNIKGWEGAVAVTKESEAGRIASNRFLQYRARSGVDLSYLRHWLLSDDGLEALGSASPGSADRNRTLSIAKFEAIEVPLPSLVQQERIAGYLARTEGMAMVAERAERLARSLLPAARNQVFNSLR